MEAEKRFTPHSESLSAMRYLSRTLSVVQEKIPQVEGLGFFGSRIHGREHEESDLDTVVFVNGEEYFRKQQESGRELRRRIAQRDALYEQTRSYYEETLQQVLDLPVEKITQGTIKTVAIVDLSPTLTQQLLFYFKREIVDYQTGHGEIPFEIPDISEVDPVSFHLAARFFLGVGDGLYQNRASVLDTFAKDQKGDWYFSALMHVLGGIERRLPTQKRGPVGDYQYPQTITEGRHYFRLKNER